MDDENEILIEEKEAPRAMHAYTLPCAYKFLQFLQVVITNYSSNASQFDNCISQGILLPLQN